MPSLITICLVIAASVEIMRLLILYENSFAILLDCGLEGARVPLSAVYYWTAGLRLSFVGAANFSSCAVPRFQPVIAHSKHNW